MVGQAQGNASYQQWRATNFELPTAAKNVKVGFSLQTTIDKNGEFVKGRAGALIEFKRETKNGSTIKNTTTIGKTF